MNSIASARYEDKHSTRRTGGGIIIKAVKTTTILFVLSLLVIFIFCHAPPVQAIPHPVEDGIQTWKYNEFTKSFNRYMSNRNPILSYLFLTIAVGLVALLGFEFLQRARNKINKQKSPAPLDDSSTEGTRQRRAWARIEASLMCHYTVTHSPLSAPDSKDKEWGLIVDLSGGGCKIATSRELHVGDTLDLLLEFEPRRKLALQGQVVRTEKETNTDHTFFAGIEFKNIQEPVRDQIIAWMFKHQRNLIEGQRRLEEGRCLRCGKLLSEKMRQQSMFCIQCDHFPSEFGKLPSEEKKEGGDNHITQL